MAQGTPSARFIAGYQGHRYPLTIAASILIGAVSIVVPIAGMIHQRSIGPIALLFAGVALYWPMMKAIEKNALRSYDPRHPPEELLG